MLETPRLDEMQRFYQDVLGFRLSDYVLQPFKASFFHVNARHHSLALAESGKTGVHHLMMELLNLDDVGKGYDAALAQPGRVVTTLGRHTNDSMTSFYTRTPGTFAATIARNLKLPRPTVYRILESLEQEGLVYPSPSGGGFRLTANVGLLSDGFAGEDWGADVAAPLLNHPGSELTSPTGLTVSNTSSVPSFG
ncbi:catechol 2,3-dioxygenase-like lactoylglutathione lyase family enzyme [Azospirillum lipoferum]|uniref:VOC family protein n=1 Tax=Azospirillum TaxID=191 RepID=UPI001B3B75A7|nr:MULTISPECIES: VOC family protein [Azospirillum]MCP1610982.1 catechol 2,3-dioxygenase-like lactoylglutathione lyase family enzyme [Azospirillum lipoferum]MDW5533885.1 VOC family protein [Azospirillum sp. NL1]